MARTTRTTRIPRKTVANKVRTAKKTKPAATRKPAAAKKPRKTTTSTTGGANNKPKQRKPRTILPALRRVALAGSAGMRVAHDALPTFLAQIAPFVHDIVTRAVVLAESAKRKTVRSADISYAYATVTGKTLLTNSKDKTYAKVTSCSRASRTADTCLQIPHTAFVRMVRDFAPKTQKFSAGSLKLIQILAEQLLGRVANAMKNTAAHARRKTIRSENISTAMRIKKAFNM